ncbi:Histone acetyltransferase type B catalytic subunit [Zea mays]|uniref:Histone acetyltransferase type B catalytic subunit n=1 Tax=Zea mays TaxID=4577 RepID=A0A1D6L196_MAIZE|nr:Histone acetyltransferase type B catalytic subunit [Zea mays]ONM08347.1 Histone acetyltransferase type B catalytic subunit [Zea mays]
MKQPKTIILVFGSGIITIILSSSVSLLWLLLVCVCPLMRSALQLLLPNAEAAVYITGSICAAFVANIDGHSDKTVTFNGRMLSWKKLDSQVLRPNLYVPPKQYPNCKHFDGCKADLVVCDGGFG